MKTSGYYDDKQKPHRVVRKFRVPPGTCPRRTPLDCERRRAPQFVQNHSNVLPDDVDKAFKHKRNTKHVQTIQGRC